jgi:hypothetical protein
MAAQTRQQLMESISWRLANETRVGQNRFWSDQDVHDAITQALLKAEPLGNPATVQMTFDGYASTPQQPEIDVIAIKEVWVEARSQSMTAPPVYQLAPRHYKHYRNNERWLWLNNPPGQGDVLRIHCVQAYNLSENPDVLITADIEMVFSYAMAALYQRYLNNGQIEGVRGEFDYYLQHEQKGDMRRQQMEFLVYPERMMKDDSKGGKK